MFPLLFILFCLCWFIPVYTYGLYPLSLWLFAKKIQLSKNNYNAVSHWPEVTIVFSVFNEESVIRRKLESIIRSHYPSEKIMVLIGSDYSTDATNAIIEEYATTYPNIRLVKKTSRQGKLKIINELISLTATKYLILTDANVFFEPDTIKALVYSLIEKKAAMACGNILKFSPHHQGISGQEVLYMNFENRLKYHESLNYGFIVGVEGGCYAIQKNWFVPVPDGFLMDDFFVTLDVISKKGLVLFEPEAVCYEDVNDEPLIEFKRKIRISLGNFRNLSYYKHMLFPIYKGFGFAFFSHKVLRWLTPFAIVISFLISLILSHDTPIFVVINWAYATLCLFPILTICLEKIQLKLPVINFFGHFMLMNLALFIGFFKFLSASHESAWEPPKRNV